MQFAYTTSVHCTLYRFKLPDFLHFSKSCIFHLKLIINCRENVFCQFNAFNMTRTGGGVNLCFKGKAKKDKNLDNIYTKGEGTGKLSRSRGGGGNVQREGV